MDRYFFHVACARGMFMDESGRDFSDLKGAKTYAAKIAAELARDGGWGRRLGLHRQRKR